MNERRDSKVRMIPIDHIIVLNPRERAQRKFKQIVDNIATLGLKKPVTVTPKEPDETGEEFFYLVCGQGRLEACDILGQKKIPALVVDVSKEELLLMSLVENLARRQHSSIELVRDIGELRNRGYTFSEIAEKTALNVSYVRGIVKLLKQGEERLLQAVENGQIPVTIAVTIASSDDLEIQKALTEAYEKNTLRGNKLLAARRLVEKRKTDGKGIRTGQHKQVDAVSSEKLLMTYQQETSRQRMIIQKSKVYETRLLFVVSALRQLLENENFVTLLRAESLDTLPTYLSNQLQGETP